MPDELRLNLQERLRKLQMAAESPAPAPVDPDELRLQSELMRGSVPSWTAICRPSREMGGTIVEASNTSFSDWPKIDAVRVIILDGRAFLSRWVFSGEPGGGVSLGKHHTLPTTFCRRELNS